ncbi:hypothetical protein N5923_20230 [Erwiniaceae bacterium BAC15a-03b]|uniref:Uncharacterized protein n=1 Tax=Winslowiella arboricola TaxID=2978220 RepID=A0A9J6PVT7_9GAMM|nr:hypothetical protein [Winslowiella arboricola]MCU5772300.1 hypothetical protein [Winslowiella arboricola]MCU5779821.1 hypothetical protein [Winslowiella arboricola]
MIFAAFFLRVYSELAVGNHIPLWHSFCSTQSLMVWKISATGELGMLVLDGSAFSLYAAAGYMLAGRGVRTDAVAGVTITKREKAPCGAFGV